MAISNRNIKKINKGKTKEKYNNQYHHNLSRRRGLDSESEMSRLNQNDLDTNQNLIFIM
jgi:hypothetical protein